MNAWRVQVKHFLSFIFSFEWFYSRLRYYNWFFFKFLLEQELISIEGEDGIIYQMTPEQQQMLINNGTFRVDSRVVQDEVNFLKKLI